MRCGTSRCRARPAAWSWSSTAAEVAAAGGPDPGFEVELNTGARMDFRATYAGADRRRARRHVLVRASTAASSPNAAGRCTGRRRPRCSGRSPRRDLLDLLIASLRWHLAGCDTDEVAHDDDAPAWTDDAVLNACRAWHRVRTGQWSSKVTAGRRLLTDDAAGDRSRRSGPGGRLEQAAGRPRRRFTAPTRRPGAELPAERPSVSCSTGARVSWSGGDAALPSAVEGTGRISLEAASPAAPIAARLPRPSAATMSGGSGSDGAPAIRSLTQRAFGSHRRSNFAARSTARFSRFFPR